MEKVVRDGKVAVLFSPGYGAGWFTWNSDYPECIFHPELVRLVEEGKNAEAGKLAEKLFKDFYSGGSRDLRIEWLPIGTQFRLNEYDGNESLIYQLDEELFIA